MHPAVIDYVTRVRDAQALTGAVLDLGGRDVNGTVRDLFPGSRYVVVDIAEHSSVDVVGDAADVNLDEKFDVVITTECLEHTARGAEIVANAFRHLQYGGTFIATMAGPGRMEHGASGESSPPAGEWYRNVDPAELRQWLTAAGFGDFEVDVAGCDVRCWARRW